MSVSSHRNQLAPPSSLFLQASSKETSAAQRRSILLLNTKRRFHILINTAVCKYIIIIMLQRPESGCVVLVLVCVGVCVVRPFPGGRHSHAARRAG